MTAAAPASAAAAWRPRDCHAHTTFSDGELTPEALVAAAEARGVRPSVADHCSRDVAFAVKEVPAFEAYVSSLERMREAVPDLAISGEFCWHDALWREVPRPLWARLTHAVGSVHAVHLPPELGGGRLHMFARRWPEGLDVDAYMDAHVADVERFLGEMPVDVFAHPTLVPLPLRAHPSEELWTEAREERLVAALGRSGVAFEVSNRYRPPARLVARAAAAGVRLSLGSDGHAAEQVADVAWPLATARAAGVSDAELYEPTVHGRRAARA